MHLVFYALEVFAPKFFADSVHKAQIRSCSSWHDVGGDQRLQTSCLRISPREAGPIRHEESCKLGGDEARYDASRQILKKMLDTLTQCAVNAHAALVSHQ